MKTYDQLTISQKEAAVEHAHKELKELVSLGMIDFGNGDGPTDETIRYYAVAGAEGSLYSEHGDRIVEGIADEN